MKTIIQGIIILTVVAAISCNNSNGIAKVASSTTSSVVSTDASKGGYGSFTFTSNGQKRTFTCWHPFFLMPLQVSGGSVDAVMLEDGGPSNAGFDFKLNKQGATEFKTGYANILVPGLLFDFFDTTGVSYTGDGMTVHVTSLDENKITGTFSGRFVKEKSQIKDNSNAPQRFDVTEGKFDLHK
ncbi:MAG: hypothetical protein JST87_02385 [Bacteroidetes bacterium]|nr:hypothetical protein [Bacteroidota bacterium]